MGKIGFFGGAFNPPTNIHINIATNLIKERKLDKVVFVPVNDFYEKKNLAEATHRYNMLKLATKGKENLEVDDIEIKENRKLFAKDAFELISKNYYSKGYKKEDIFLIMGLDNYEKMPKWKDYKKIKDSYQYIVIDRDESLVSSTNIRNMIKNDKKEVLNYISKDLYEYIIKNNLYK